MLRRISEPLALSEASLLALRPAMNAPVLNVDYLPVGPARAAIVLFAEEYGGIGMAFGIRSTEGGQVAVFRNREPIEEERPIQEVLEPALASAERMGFLFDEDMVEGAAGSQGRRDAMALWGRLMGDIAMPPPPKAAPPLPAATEPILDLTETMVSEAPAAELVLDEVAAVDAAGAPPADSVDQTTATMREGAATAVAGAARPPPSTAVSAAAAVALPAEPAPARAARATPPATQAAARPAPVEAPAPSLSKFRSPGKAAARAGTSDPADDGDEATPNIGRVPLVRVRRGDASKRIPYLARLLSSF